MSRCCTDTDVSKGRVQKRQVLQRCRCYLDTGITKLKALHICRRYTDSGGLQMLIVHKCWLLNRCWSYTQAGVTYNRCWFRQVLIYTGVVLQVQLVHGYSTVCTYYQWQVLHICQCYTDANEMQVPIQFQTYAHATQMQVLHRCRCYTSKSVTFSHMLLVCCSHLKILDLFALA